MDDFGSPVARSRRAAGLVPGGHGYLGAWRGSLQQHGRDESHALRMRRGSESVVEDQPEAIGARSLGFSGLAGSALARVHDLYDQPLNCFSFPRCRRRAPQLASASPDRALPPDAARARGQPVQMAGPRLDHRSLNIDTFNAIYVLMGHALPEEAQSLAVYRAGTAQTGVHPQVSNRGEAAHPSGGVSFGFAVRPE